ncbi:iron donor protein CyaY [Vogesella sp. LIG4]|uniref:iron donor protein CyaY n=1 Tax=Vogesella sp. LIG4 TaxID=1192162 RepID=UPI00081F9C7A|nr:iron donor protein CyaY [Vogesella sp. LIG4]SCK13142.1 CyaY protein [Vogesella sp. LIG4]
MSETEFLSISEAIFRRIENALDDAGLDVDCVISGNVLEIEFDDGSKVVVNRHVPNQELWIAAKSGGFHFAQRDGQWIAARDGAEFGATLSQVVSAAAGEPFQFSV